MTTIVRTLAILLALAAPSGVPTSADGGHAAKLKASPLTLSQEGYNLIIKHEVGGGPSYYNRYLKRPTYPGGASGVTIGIGYDLGYNTRSRIAVDWQALSPDAIRRLQAVAGIKGTAARSKARALQSLVIPWDIAEAVYQKRTLPRFAALTEKAYPKTRTLHPHIQSALLSWTFNRGSGISATSSRDREKRAIRRDIPAHIDRLPDHFRASKRLWRGKGLPGLLTRREDEARLIESALK